MKTKKKKAIVGHTLRGDTNTTKFSNKNVKNISNEK